MNGKRQGGTRAAKKPFGQPRRAGGEGVWIGGACSARKGLRALGKCEP